MPIDKLKAYEIYTRLKEQGNYSDDSISKILTSEIKDSGSELDLKEANTLVKAFENMNYNSTEISDLKSGGYSNFLTERINKNIDYNNRPLDKYPEPESLANIEDDSFQDAFNDSSLSTEPSILNKGPEETQDTKQESSSDINPEIGAVANKEVGAEASGAIEEKPEQASEELPEELPEEQEPQKDPETELNFEELDNPGLDSLTKKVQEQESRQSIEDNNEQDSSNQQQQQPYSGQELDPLDSMQGKEEQQDSLLQGEPSQDELPQVAQSQASNNNDAESIDDILASLDQPAKPQPAKPQVKKSQKAETKSTQKDTGVSLRDIDASDQTRWQGFKAAFRSANSITWLARNSFDSLNPLNEDVPDDWKPDNWEMFYDVPPKYFDALMKAKSPYDQERIRNIILKQEEDDEIMSQAGTAELIAGGLAGSILSPESWIPVVVIAKNAKLGYGALKAMKAALPGVAAGAIAYNADKLANKKGVELSDAINDTFLDTMIGTVFMGAGYGLSHAFTSGRIWQSRNILKESIKHDVEIKPVVDPEDGTVLSYIVEGGESASAQEVDMMQRLVDSHVDMSGLFAIPYVGGWLGKLSGKLSPAFRMQTSPYKVLQNFSDKVAEHAFVTKAVKQDIPREETFEAKMINNLNGNKVFLWNVKGLHNLRNGIDAEGQYVSGIKNLKDSYTKQGYITEDEFFKEAHDVFLTGEESEHSSVNQLVSLIRDAKDPLWKSFRKAYNLPEDFQTTSLAHEHFPKDYLKQEVQENSQKWEEMGVKYLRGSDATINKRHQEITDAETKAKELEDIHDDLIKSKEVTDEEIKDSSNKLARAKSASTKLKQKLQNDLRDDENLRLLVDDFNSLSHTESENLSKIMEKHKGFEKEAESSQKSLNEAKKQLAKTVQLKNKAKTTQTAQKHAKTIEELKPKIKEHEAKLREAKNNMETEEQLLQEKALTGEIDKRYFTEASDGLSVKFKDPKDRLKFRTPYANDKARARAMGAFRETILGQNAEQTMQDTLYTVLGSRMASPNNAKRRTLLIPDTILKENGFLNSDVVGVISNYRNMIGRLTFLKQAFPELTLEGGLEDLVQLLAHEHRLRDIKVSQMPNGSKKKKAFKKINKEFKKAKSDMSNSYNRMMGRSQIDAKTRSWANAANNAAVTTKLGNLPLSMVTEPFAIVMKEGIWPTIKDGIAPALLRMEGRIKKQGREGQMGAADLNIATEHVAMGAADRNMNGLSGIDDKVNAFERVTGSLAQHSGNFTFANYIDNWLQRISANVVNSKIIRQMHEYQAGTLSQRDKENLLQIGIDPKKWSGRFIEQWKAAGADTNGVGGYHANHQIWTDEEASILFGAAVRNTVRDTVIRKGMFDTPFIADHPWTQFYMTFKGWLSASFSKFTIPLMQRGDARMISGAIMMMAVGTLVSPMRRMAIGKPAFTDDDSMFWNAMVDGGAFSSIASFVEDANILAQGKILEGIQSEKYRKITLAGMAGGVVGGMAEDTAKTINMALTQNWNKTEVRRASRLMPFLSSWQLRRQVDKMVESLNIPDTKAEANANRRQAKWPL